MHAPTVYKLITMDTTSSRRVCMYLVMSATKVLNQLRHQNVSDPNSVCAHFIVIAHVQWLNHHAVCCSLPTFIT